MRIVTVFLIACLSAIAVRAAQDADPRFDVVSVKANRSGDAAGGIDIVPGRMNAGNVTVRLLVRDAYGVRDRQIVEGPPWAMGEWGSADHFDIQATMPIDATPETVTGMLRSLLRDRFRLAAHFESRPTAVYALVAPRPAARNLKPADPERCARGADDGGSPPPAPRAVAGPVGTAPADVTRTPCGMVAFSPGRLTGRSISLEQAAAALANRTAGDVDRPVIDRSGLTGLFDIDLSWTPLGSGATDGPSLFTAVQEQLGLRLDSQQAPMEFLVIDHIERPTEN